jgi:multicomponent Na+:H+ antiporter subunit A
MTVLILLHAVIAITAPALARALGRRVFGWIAIAPVATLIWLAPRLGDLLDGGAIVETTEWVPALNLELGLRLDAFGALMVLLVSGIGTLVFAYSGSYFHERPDLGRFAMLLCGFSGAMLGLVLADNLLALFVFWELTSITSYLLIGFDDLKESSRKAALQALMITGGGGLALLAGLVIVGQQAGTWSLAEVLADPPTEGAVMSWAVVLDPRRRVHQVGPGAVPHVVARGDGRPDPGERLPALGHHGEGRGLPGRPFLARPLPTWGCGVH